jgi:hypothetical protein
MSVDDPRPAAAQRTAAGTRRRARLCATWLFIVPLLAFFSFSVVAGARTFEKPNVGKAVGELPNADHVVEVPVSAGRGSGGNDNGNDNGNDKGNSSDLIDRFARSEHYVCSVTASQLVQIKQRYRTGRYTLSLRGRPIDIVTVYDANERDLRAYLGAGGVSCVLVQVSHVFFLPFDAHGS